MCTRLALVSRVARDLVQSKDRCIFKKEKLRDEKKSPALRTTVYIQVKQRCSYRNDGRLTKSLPSA
jgi:hypothetical protein